MGKNSKIFQARKVAGLSRAEMARVLEIPVRTIENWEAEIRTPPAYLEKLIAEKMQRISIKENLKNEVRKEAYISNLENMDYMDGVEYLLSCGYTHGKNDSFMEECKEAGICSISEYWKLRLQPGDDEYDEENEEYNSAIIAWEYSVPIGEEETVEVRAAKWRDGYWNEVSARGSV